MTELTTDQVIAFAAEAVAEHGEDHLSPLYFYTGFGSDATPTDEVDSDRSLLSSMCRYTTPDGAAGCIVGQILHKAGVSIEALGSVEGKAASKVVTDPMVTQFVSAKEAVRRLLSAMQQAQDSGAPWGAVVEAAKADYAIDALHILAEAHSA